ncbi:hypothetical protein ACTZWT_12130 [Rhodopseudomonas sp. NSM]
MERVEILRRSATAQKNDLQLKRPRAIAIAAILRIAMQHRRACGCRAHDSQQNSTAGPRAAAQLGNPPFRRSRGSARRAVAAEI